MKIQRSALDQGVSLLTVSGDFDAFAANPFLEQIETIVQGGSIHLVVNLRLVLFINSTAIGCLIKSRKRLRGLGGDLVLSETSQRAKAALESLGLGSVLKGFDSDDEAFAFLTADSDESVEIPSENAVLLKFSDSDKQAALSEAGRSAKMDALEENGIHFIATGDASLFASGAELKAKFRLPLFRRAYYFDLPCTVVSAENDADGVRVFAEFGDIYDEDRRSIAQFLRDMRLLKDEIRGETEG